MQDTWEIFTLRMRTSHQPTASYRQSPVAWESAKQGWEADEQK
jgi:hypothetical protein